MPVQKKPLPVDQIVTAYLAGDSIAKLARLHGVAHLTLKSRLRERGIVLRTLSEAQSLPPNRGRRLSAATKAKLSAARMGKPAPKPPGFGEKLSKCCALRGVYGAAHPSWKGGYSPFNRAIRRSKPYRRWRQAVYRQDGFTCQHCGDQTRGNLQAHHKKKLSVILREHDIRDIDKAEQCAELWDVGNGITLCRRCHAIEERRMDAMPADSP